MANPAADAAEKAGSEVASLSDSAEVKDDDELK